MNKWTDQFKNVEQYNNYMNEWGTALADLSAYQIKRGIELCRKQKAWPPAIAEFIELATIIGDWEHAGSAYKTYVTALPKPVNRDAGHKFIKSIKILINGK